MIEQKWFRCVGAGLLILLMAPVAALWTPLLYVSWATSLGLVLTGLAIWWRQNRDPYSLKELERAQNQADFDNAEAMYAHQAGEIVCPNCFEAYDNSRPACPRCGKLT